MARNPAGNEVACARRITATPAGVVHPLLAGRPAAWDAPAVHLDIVSELPGDVTVLASNALTPVQAAEIRHDGGVMWAVQYHPEFSLREIGSILGRRGAALIEQGFFRDDDDHRRYVAALKALHDAPDRRDLAWQLGLDAEVLDPGRRLTEIRNFITHLAKPMRSQRGRA